MKLVEERNFFVDTERVIMGNCLDTFISLPQNLIRCQANQNMRITLGTFSMRRNFYNVNYNNNKLYFVTEVAGVFDSSAQIVIEEGDYRNYNDANEGICKAWETGIDTALTSLGVVAPASSCDYDRITRKLTFTFNVTGGVFDNLKMVCFTMPNFRAETGTMLNSIIGNDSESAFQDAHVLLGGCPHTNQEASTYAELVECIPLTRNAGPPVTYNGASIYNANLSTEQNIYMRTDLNNTAFQTSSFDVSSIYPSVVTSNILAKIPYVNPYKSEIGEDQSTPPTLADTRVYNCEQDTPIIRYTDNGNDLFSLLLTSKGVASLRLFLTDAYGRRLPEISAEQLKCNGIHFTCSLKVNVYESD
tara:strand:+ start:2991 stop:4070 length:1080 start_codon:yes stop_codon:yes gene_type:complete